MIHKHIFVHAKPGMSEHDFFTYWKEVHAERYGRKIKQAKGYLINTRVPFGPQESEPPFQGVAEVWIESVEDELAFAQSKEYLEGSRLDEPNFLLWYGMFALDTTDQVIVEPPAGDWPGVKVFVVTKRKPGMSLEEYRTYGREVHAPKVAKLPGPARLRHLRRQRRPLRRRRVAAGHRLDALVRQHRRHSRRPSSRTCSRTRLRRTSPTSSISATSTCS